jgi:hypothetical protein
MGLDELKERATAALGGGSATDYVVASKVAFALGLKPLDQLRHLLEVVMLLPSKQKERAGITVELEETLSDIYAVTMAFLYKRGEASVTIPLPSRPGEEERFFVFRTQDGVYLWIREEDVDEITSYVSREELEEVWNSDNPNRRGNRYALLVEALKNVEKTDALKLEVAFVSTATAIALPVVTNILSTLNTDTLERAFHARS